MVNFPEAINMLVSKYIGNFFLEQERDFITPFSKFHPWMLLTFWLGKPCESTGKWKVTIQTQVCTSVTSGQGI